MVSIGVTTCPKCGGELKYYDNVGRIVRSKWGRTSRIRIRRLRCVRCRAMHREIPELIFPYKEYEAEVILGVLEGLITYETIGFEDYPCELTMKIWKSQEKHLLLWRNPYLKGVCTYEIDTCKCCTSERLP